MPDIIHAKLSELLSDPDLTESYLETIGLKLAFDLPNQVFQIELERVPEVIQRLEEAGGLKEHITHLDITAITGHGVTLYLSHPKAGDGYIFIPSENINAIHTMSEDFITAVETFAPQQIPKKKRPPNPDIPLKKPPKPKTIEKRDI